MNESKAAKERNTAVIVFHGMGQQVPFETLGEVAERIRRQGPWSQGGHDPKTRAGNVPCRAPEAAPDAILPRIRMTLADPEQPGGVRNIDFYESYWAPVTAGKVSLGDTLIFLIQGGWAGIRFTFPSRFSRYFWGSVRSFPLPVMGNLALLSAALAVVLGIGGLILGLGFALPGGAWKEYLASLSFLFRALHIAALPILLALLFSRHKLPVPSQAGVAAAILLGLLSAFTAVPSGLLSGLGLEALSGRPALDALSFWILLGIFVLDILVLSLAARRFSRKGFASDYFSRVVWLQAGVVGVTLVGGMLATAFLTVRGSGNLGLGGGIPLWTYGVLGVIFITVLRKFLIEYVGDLAAYLSTHKASKFAEIRSRIQADAFKVAGHVFASGSTREKDDDTFYSEVMFVGHSLGSVIAYDTLNGIINQDLVHLDGAWKAVERTKLLLTFGSPLDKTAFILRAQVKDNLCREMLASAKQPLLQEEHAFRPMAWVNVWSPCDIISGPLEFYDRGTVEPVEMPVDAEFAFTYDDTAVADPVEVRTTIQGGDRPDRRPLPVVSLVDPEADIPFGAHTQFWKNTLIYRILSQALQDPGDGSGFGKFIRITAKVPPKTS